MFKRRSEKNKIKTVFKLQFQATRVPQSKKAKFTISLVPEDAGKPTVRLEKVAVQDDTCIWENPVYETVKLTRESKTGTVNDKIYYFVLSSGSSKSGFVGEVGINFADFTEATVPTVLSLPLTTSDSGALLHVTIQKMEGDMDPKEPFRDEDVSLKFDSQDRRLEDQMISKRDVNGSHHSVEDEDLDETAYQDPTEHLTHSGHNSVLQKETSNDVLRRSSTTCSVGSDGSMAESSNSTDYNYTGEALEETLNSLIEKPKPEVVNSARRTELLELELQTLRKQVVRESKKGHDLSTKNARLKEERDAFEKECERLKLLQKKSMDKSDFSDKSQQDADESGTVLDDIRKELKFEKRLNLKLRSQLNSTQDSNSELVLVVKDLKRMLNQKKREPSHPSGNLEADGLSEEFRENVCKWKLGKDGDLDELQGLVKMREDANETDLLKQKIAKLSNEINIYRKEMEELENHMEQLALENKNLKLENHDLSFKSKENQREHKNMQSETCSYLATIKELESQMEILKTENKKREHEFEKSFSTIEELVNQVRDLEIELEKQQERFEEDAEAIIQAKTEQEQRAIRAEEALRKTRQSHSITAEKLQEEFRMLSVEMASKFDENEKMTMKAQTEASELRLQKSRLEEILQKANEELDLFKDHHQVKLRELSDLLDAKAKQIEKLSTELDGKSLELDNAKQRSEENDEASSMQIKMLRDDIERLTRERKDFAKQTEQKEKLREEMEQMKKKVEEKEMLMQRLIEDKNILERKYSLARMEAEKSQEDLNSMKCLRDEGDAMVGNLLSELEKLRVEYKELKCCVNKEELEKEDLQRQIIQLKCDLQKKEEAISSLEKKLKQNSAQDGAVQTTSRNSKSIRLQDSHSQELASLKKRIKTLEEQIKLKETALGNSSNSFQEKEKILKSKIKELENSVKQLNSERFYKNEKDVKQAGHATVDSSALNEERNKGRDILRKKMNTTEGMQGQNGFDAIPRDEYNSSEKELKTTSFSTKLLTEMTTLKERNKIMEAELKEMEERYSEISLRFAEVEGERQQLVMTVRNLKNGKKN